MATKKKKKAKKLKKLSMRKGMKVVLYGCKRWESDGSYQSLRDLEMLQSRPCDIETYANGCDGCTGQVAYTFQLIDKKLMASVNG